MFVPRSKSISMLLIFLILFVFLTQPAGAETKGGDLEINTQFTYQNLDVDKADDSTDYLIFKFRLGYFFNPNVNLEVSADSFNTSADNFDTSNFALETRTNYHFLISGVVIPYLGPSLGLLYDSFDAGSIDDSDTSGIFGGQLGLKTFVTETVAITTEYSIRRTFGRDPEDLNINQVLVGISYFWR